MIVYIIVLISFVLDGVLSNFLPYLNNNLSFFTPLLTLVSVLIIYRFYQKQEKKYFITVFIIGLLYDLFYTNLIFFNAVLFTIIAFFNYKAQKNISVNAINLLLQTIIFIVLYESLTGIILLVFNVVPISIYKVGYKILHSLLLNVMYVEIVYFIIKVLPNKYLRRKLN